MCHSALRAHKIPEKINIKSFQSVLELENIALNPASIASLPHQPVFSAITISR